MDFFRNFVNQMVTSMPIVTKVAYVNVHIKNYMKELERDDTFRHKFTMILQMFINRQITVEDMCQIMDAVDGLKLTRRQIEYLVNRVYYNDHIILILQSYVRNQHLDDDEIDDVAQFLVHEVNNAIIYEK
nr:orf53 [Trichoplusia ni single nucleopolyhedrovirus]